MDVESSQGSESMFKGHRAKERFHGISEFRGRQGWVTGNEGPVDQVYQPKGH